MQIIAFGWARSPGNCFVLSSAAEHSHCRTSIANAVILPEGVEIMSHVKAVEPPVGSGKTNDAVPKDVTVLGCCRQAGGDGPPFFCHGVRSRWFYIGKNATRATCGSISTHSLVASGILSLCLIIQIMQDCSNREKRANAYTLYYKLQKRYRLGHYGR